MAATSKKQRRFMALVRGVQKGTIKPKDVSKDVKDAAKSMKEKDVKDFISTKEKDLPDKVKKETIRKLRSIIREIILESNLYNHAKKELKLAGYKNINKKKIESDDDYMNYIGKSVLELIEQFAKQRHSGMSAEFTKELFNKLVSFENLTELTDDPKEWEDRSEISNPDLWQSKRNPAIFSKDAGKTWYSVNENIILKAKKLFVNKINEISLTRSDIEAIKDIIHDELFNLFKKLWIKRKSLE